MRPIGLFFFLFINLLSTGDSWSQELPPITNYQAEDYSAGNQNWSITQGEDNHIYAANNQGLLVYDGSVWTLYPTPNNTILRSVRAVGNKIYSGSYMDFGYWEKDDLGQSIYTSLVTTLAINVKEDEQFWTILEYGEYILFQSLSRIYVYNANSKQTKIIESDETIYRLYKTENDIFFHISGKGLYTIKDGEKHLVSDHDIFKNDIIVDVFNISEDLIVVSQTSGVFQFSSGNLRPYSVSIQNGLKGKTVYSAKFLSSNELSIGTISNGVLIFASDGTLLHAVDKYKGLTGNTALSLFEDRQKNLWIGLDNGIDCLNIESPYRNYVDQVGSLGTTYASVLFNGYLYLGTNQGLFVKTYKKDEDFKLVPGTEGQVWTLDVIDNTLFCGHNNGTFTVLGPVATKVASIMGTWDLVKIDKNPSLLLQGNYDGLYVLEKINNRWKLRNKIEGFDISSRYFEMVNPNEILVSHEYKGVYKVELENDLSKTIAVSIEPSVEMGANSSLVKYDDKIWYASEEGLFYYNTDSDSFEKEEALDVLYTKDSYVSGKLVNDTNGKLWVFTKEAVIAISKQGLDNSYKLQRISISETLRKEKKGFENLSFLEDDTYLYGTSSGYLLMDTTVNGQPNYNVAINSIYNGKSKEKTTLVPLISNETVFNAEENFITFNYSVLDFSKYRLIEYQYKLKEDENEPWSEWSTDNQEAFENLRFGSYLFQIRTRVNGIIQKDAASFAFSIKRPWFLSYLAIFFYVLLLISSFYFINLWNKKNYKKERTRLLEKNERILALNELETQKELIQLRNEKLNQDIEARNRELAISTMSMIKKNNVLNEFKEELVKLKDSEGIKPLIKKINMSLSDTEDWDFFEEAFNHADKDFFKKVKTLHPELTANDLRLCVYLRLNLSSKEIAPLLNISPRSVEIKRYRLRKKISLDREVNLNNYFIDM